MSLAKAFYNWLTCHRVHHHIRFWYLRCCGCPGLGGRQHLPSYQHLYFLKHSENLQRLDSKVRENEDRSLTELRGGALCDLLEVQNTKKLGFGRKNYQKLNNVCYMKRNLNSNFVHIILHPIYQNNMDNKESYNPGSNSCVWRPGGRTLCNLN